MKCFSNGSKCFGNGSPNITLTEYIYNKKSKVNYHHISERAHRQKCKTVDGKVKMDCSGFLTNVDSFESYLSLTYGQALCAPCDVSSTLIQTCGVICPSGCQIPISQHFINTLLTVLNGGGGSVTEEALFSGGIGPTSIILPWNVLRSPEAWNSYGVIYDGSNNITIELCDGSFNPLSDPNLDGEMNILDASGNGIYGANVCIHENNNLFNNTCSTSVYPEGTFSFSFKEVVNAWLYANEGSTNPTVAPWVTTLKEAGYYPARPRITVENYLNPVNGFHFPGPIRFFLAKG